jgi:hypothetical protein
MARPKATLRLNESKDRLLWVGLRGILGRNFSPPNVLGNIDQDIKPSQACFGEQSRMIQEDDLSLGKRKGLALTSLDVDIVAHSE